MNERIKLHIDQAEKYASRTFVADTASWKLAFNQKFAELLINECRSIVANGLFDEEKFNPDSAFDKGHNAALENAVAGLNLNFGVNV